MALRGAPPLPGLVAGSEKDSALAAIAERVVLEITKRASLHRIDDLKCKMRALRDLGFRIAVEISAPGASSPALA
jgi:hypothetical protein